MNKEEATKKTMEVIENPSNHSNSDLQFAMDIINKDYELVKQTLIDMTHHLDSLEESYNKVLKEYNSRNGGK